MIETRALAQEVQDQLLAAMHRGQDQFRKSQKQIRRSQYHLRKSREAMADAIRNGNQVAKAIRPLTDPADRAKLRADALGLADQVVATQRRFADRALEVTGPLAEQLIAAQRQLASRALQATGPLAEQVVETQRQLAGRALHANPFVADRVAKLTQAVGTLPGMRRLGLADGVAPGKAVADDEVRPAGAFAEIREIRPTATATESVKASKARTPRASSARAAGPSKSRATSAARATKSAGTAKTAGTSRSTGTAKSAGTAKPRSAKAAGTTRTARTSKPRSTKN
jgi:hypothetical protein